MTVNFGIDSKMIFDGDKSLDKRLLEHDDAINLKANQIDMNNKANQSDVTPLSAQSADNLQRHKNTWLDVKQEFSALGNGVLDDTVSIQNACNKANTAGSVKLYFPEGTYITTDAIRLYKNTTIEMHPKAVIKRSGSINKVFMNGPSGDSSYATGYGGDGNIHFIGGTIDLNRDSLTFNTTGSMTAGVNTLIVDNITGITSGMYITVKGAGASGADFYATISSISGNVITFLDSNGNPINANTTVTGAQCTAIKTISAFDLSHGENITFTQLTITNGHSGHYMQLTGVKSVRIRDCRFTNQLHAYLGSYMFEVIQVEATSTTSFPTFGAWDYTPSVDILVEGTIFDNTIRGVGNHSDGKYGTGSVIYGDGLRVLNCKFTNIADIPVTLTGFRNFVVANNTIDTTGSAGIDAYNSSYGTIRDNTVRNTQKAGLNTNNLNWTRIVGNTFENTSAHPTNQYACIRLTDSSNLSIYDNIAQDTTPRYSYPIFGSGTWTNNKQFNNNMKVGTNGAFSGVGNLIWVSGGDSITAGGNLDSGGVSQGYYQDTAMNYLPQVNKYYNKGYGGYCASISPTSAYSSLTSVTSTFQVADIYTIFIGTNDFSRNVPLGSITDASGTTNSFYGGLIKIYNDLLAKNPNATIIFITPTKRTTSATSTIAWDTANTAGLKLVDYVNAIKALASDRGCDVIDLFNISGITTATIDTFTYDHLHPNINGNIRIGAIIGKGIYSRIA